MTIETIPSALTGLLSGLHAGDIKKVAEHVSDDITVKSPIFAEPFVGREQALGVIGHLLSIVDEFGTGEILQGDNKFAVMLKLQVGTTSVEGVDVLTVDQDGKVDSMAIQWRPLSAIVEVQNRLAPAVGVPALTLTPAS